MFRQTQQVQQGWKTWIQVQELAAACHLDAITLSISAHYTRLGVGGELLKQRQLPGIELGSERLQDGAEILINHGRKVRLVVTGQESAKRSGMSQRCTICMGFYCVEEQRSRRRHDHVTVREGIVVLGRESRSLRLDGVERSSTDLCLMDREAGLI